jgi:hypothetical protein
MLYTMGRNDQVYINMPIFSNQTSKEQHQILVIFSPSFLSILLSFLVVLAVVGGTIVATVYTTSIAPNFIATLNQQASTNKSVAHTYGTATNFLNGNSAFSDAPLALFWAMVGVGVYATVISMGSLLRSVSETKRETKYKHVDHDAFVRITLVRLLIRLFGIVLAWFVLDGLIKYIFPYTVAAAHVASQGSWVQHISYAIAAALGIMVGLHILVVVIRLIWLRVRLFS